MKAAHEAERDDGVSARLLTGGLNPSTCPHWDLYPACETGSPLRSMGSQRRLGHRIRHEMLAIDIDKVRMQRRSRTGWQATRGNWKSDRVRYFPVIGVPVP